MSLTIDGLPVGTNFALPRHRQFQSASSSDQSRSFYEDIRNWKAIVHTFMLIDFLDDGVWKESRRHVREVMEHAFAETHATVSTPETNCSLCHSKLESGTNPNEM